MMSIIVRLIGFLFIVNSVYMVKVAFDHYSDLFLLFFFITLAILSMILGVGVALLKKRAMVWLVLILGYSVVMSSLSLTDEATFTSNNYIHVILEIITLLSMMAVLYFAIPSPKNKIQ